NKSDMPGMPCVSGTSGLVSLFASIFPASAAGATAYSEGIAVDAAGAVVGLGGSVVLLQPASATTMINMVVMRSTIIMTSPPLLCPNGRATLPTIPRVFALRLDSLAKPWRTSIRRAEAPVDRHQMPCHVVGSIRGKKHCSAGDLRRIAPTPCGSAPLYPRQELLIRR